MSYHDNKEYKILIIIALINKLSKFNSYRIKTWVKIKKNVVINFLICTFFKQNLRFTNSFIHVCILIGS